MVATFPPHGPADEGLCTEVLHENVYRFCILLFSISEENIVWKTTGVKSEFYELGPQLRNI